jgi:peptide/nickel transport system ATP-binding protein
MESVPILQVENLYKHFPVSQGILSMLSRRSRQMVRAVDGVSFELMQGEILALVGESGSGKTTVGMNVLGLQIPTKGRILFGGNNMADWSQGILSEGVSRGDMAGSNQRERVLALRRKAQMIFQDPYESLNPRQKIFNIVAEPLEIHGLAGARAEKRERVRKALETCGLAPADHYWDRFPSELSGGQRQRVVIAGSLILDPELLVADEPVSMLDVSIRADILALLLKLRDQLGVTILYITHDLATAAFFTDRIAVMYLGKIMEIGSTKTVLKNPRHPYTQALLSVIPVPNPRRKRKRMILKGETPNPIDVPAGCRFHPRCPMAFDECSFKEPNLRSVNVDHQVACLLV